MIPAMLSVDRLSQAFVQNPPDLRVSINGVEFSSRVMEYKVTAIETQNDEAVAGQGWAKVISIDPATNKATASTRRGAASFKMKRGRIVAWLKASPIPEGALNADQPPEGPAELPEPVQEVAN